MRPQLGQDEPRGGSLFVSQESLAQEKWLEGFEALEPQLGLPVAILCAICVIRSLQEHANLTFFERDSAQERETTISLQKDTPIPLLPGTRPPPARAGVGWFFAEQSRASDSTMGSRWTSLRVGRRSRRACKKCRSSASREVPRRARASRPRQRRAARLHK